MGTKQKLIDMGFPATEIRQMVSLQQDMIVSATKSGKVGPNVIHGFEYTAKILETVAGIIEE